MKTVWVRICIGVREGIGPGFPDTNVISDIQVFNYQVEDSIEIEVRSLQPCTCPDLLTADKLGFCKSCGGSLIGRVTTNTKLVGRIN